MSDYIRREDVLNEAAECFGGVHAIIFFAKRIESLPADPVAAAAVALAQAVVGFDDAKRKRMMQVSDWPEQRALRRALAAYRAAVAKREEAPDA